MFQQQPRREDRYQGAVIEFNGGINRVSQRRTIRPLRRGTCYAFRGSQIGVLASFFGCNVDVSAAKINNESASSNHTKTLLQRHSAAFRNGARSTNKSSSCPFLLFHPALPTKFLLPASIAEILDNGFDSAEYY